MPAAVNEIEIRAGGATLYGMLDLPDDARGLVVFAHGSGSSRFSVRNRQVAEFLGERRLGTLLFDLLTSDEERIDAVTRELRFDIPFLAGRLAEVTEWLAAKLGTPPPLGLFGSSTGAAAAIVAATLTTEPIAAIVSRGGRPDLAGDALDRVASPTLLIVGGHDYQVLELNELALERMRCAKELVVVPGATHLFEEPGTLAVAAGHARDWFLRHFETAGRD